jgi:alpha-L-fucosidase
MKDGRQGENHQDFTQEDIRFMTKDGNLYAFVLASPARDILITTLGTSGPLSGQIQSLALLGSSETLKWSRSAEGLAIKRPESLPCQYLAGFRIILR